MTRDVMKGDENKQIKENEITYQNKRDKMSPAEMKQEIQVSSAENC